MAIFCGNCGMKLDPVTGLCPNCQPDVPKSPKAKNKMIIPIVAAVIVVVTVITIILLVHFGIIGGRNKTPDNKENTGSSVTKTTEVISHNTDLITKPTASDETTTVPPETTTKHEVTKKPAVDYAELYANLLKSRLNDSGIEFMTFGLVFIDGDNIPELVVSNGYFHVSSADIYTIKNDRCVNIGNVGSFGSFRYVPYGNLIESEYTGMGASNLTYLKISGNSFITVREFNCAEGMPAYGDSYSIDNVEVSKAEYTKAYDEFMSKYNFSSYQSDNASSLTSGNVSLFRDYPERFMF